LTVEEADAAQAIEKYRAAHPERAGVRHVQPSRDSRSVAEQRPSESALEP
jgi:hypothetical protein